MSEKPLRIVNALAPIRIADNGGWTDTWFAGYGKVFHIAVTPGVEVQMQVFRAGGARPPTTIHVENYDDRYSFERPNGVYGKHPLIEAIFDYIPVPEEYAVELSIFSEVPGGCSTGTSAAVSVAVIGALDALTPGRLSAHEVAAVAQRVETELLKQQCGIQDQIASAYGGINFIEMFNYPHAAVSQIGLTEVLERELEARLALIFVGETHSSSDMHRMVIRGLEDAGPEAPKLAPLRLTAARSKDALAAGDFAALGRAMIDNTEAQRNLHRDLVGPRHQRIIDVARECGAIGWKVNGAGGAGGSVTLLSGADRTEKRSMLHAIGSADPQFRNIPIQLSRRGLCVWES
jgi:D-glycero-alpha-D-manno-heptose-7-phosphate kinase